MKKLRFAGGILLWVVVCASSALAADRTLADDQGRTVTLRESPTPDFFHYTNERFAFTVDVSALFEKAFVVPDNGDGVILSDAGARPVFGRPAATGWTKKRSGSCLKPSARNSAAPWPMPTREKRFISSPGPGTMKSITISSFSAPQPGATWN